MAQWTAAEVSLSDTSEQTLVAAPGSGRAIAVHLIFGSNAGASLSTVSFKDGATARFKPSMAANGGGFAVPFPRMWILAPGNALKVSQSASVVSSVSAVYEIVIP